MHGATCGVQWMDKTTMAKHRYCITVSMIHPEGKKEAEAFNNNRVIICFACLNDLSKKVNEENEWDLMRYEFEI